jgi:5-methylcytosine-specific restriction enzyme subunit McrC
VTVIELDELGPRAEVPLSLDQGRLLAASGVVTAVPSPYQPGIWLVGPAGKGGAARVGDVEVRIRPEVGIGRLLFLLGYSAHAAAWQAGAVSVGEAARS